MEADAYAYTSALQKLICCSVGTHQLSTHGIPLSHSQT